MIRSLISSAEHVNKQLANVLTHYQKNAPHKVILHHPLQVHQYPGIKGLGLLSGQQISSNSKIVSVSTTQALTGFEILDADRNTSSRLNEIAEKIAKKYHENNQNQYYNNINILKLVFQLAVQKEDPNLTAHLYSSFLFANSPKHVPCNWPNQYEQYVFSKHLSTLIDSQKSYLLALTGDVETSGLPLIKYPLMLESVGIIRSRSLNFLPHEPKKFTKETALIVSPVTDLINHSFEPNCHVEGYYNSIENDSFVEIRALRDIKAGEELTINYGDMSNYDYLMKFGFLNNNNPFDEYYLNLDFGSAVGYTGQVFELKQKIFSLTSDLKLENIKVYRNRIDANMLANLRVYFLTEEDVKANTEIYSYTPRDFKVKVNDKNERRIFELIIQNIEKELAKSRATKHRVLDAVKLPENLTREACSDLKSLANVRDKVKDEIVANIIQIGLEEEDILQKNLEFCKAQLKGLSQ